MIDAFPLQEWTDHIKDALNQQIVPAVPLAVPSATLMYSSTVVMVGIGDSFLCMATSVGAHLLNEMVLFTQNFNREI